LTPSPEIYTLSLHDALPICHGGPEGVSAVDYEAWRERVIGYLDRHRRETDDPALARALQRLTSIAVWVLDQNRYKPHVGAAELRDRKSTRLNSSHVKNSYAV